VCGVDWRVQVCGVDWRVQVCGVDWRVQVCGVDWRVQVCVALMQAGAIAAEQSRNATWVPWSSELATFEAASFGGRGA
jgi:hypothetical protein